MEPALDRINKQGGNHMPKTGFRTLMKVSVKSRDFVPTIEASLGFARIDTRTGIVEEFVSKYPDGIERIKRQLLACDAIIPEAGKRIVMAKKPVKAVERIIDPEKITLENIDIANPIALHGYYKENHTDANRAKDSTNKAMREWVKLHLTQKEISGKKTDPDAGKTPVEPNEPVEPEAAIDTTPDVINDPPDDTEDDKPSKTSIRKMQTDELVALAKEYSVNIEEGMGLGQMRALLIIGIYGEE